MSINLTTSSAAEFFLRSTGETDTASGLPAETNITFSGNEEAFGIGSGGIGGLDYLTLILSTGRVADLIPGEGGGDGGTSGENNEGDGDGDGGDGGDGGPILLLSDEIIPPPGEEITEEDYTDGTDFGDDGEPDVIKATFEIPVDAERGTIGFDFNFLSNEFPDFVDAGFNDNLTITIDGGENIARDLSGNLIDIDTSNFTAGGNGTSLNGETGALRIAAPFDNTDGDGTVTIEITISDVGDGILDSAVFINNFNVRPVQTFFVDFSGGSMDFGNAIFGQSLGPLLGTLYGDTKTVTDALLSTDEQNEIVGRINEIYGDFNVQFVSEQPTSGDYSTVFVGQHDGDENGGRAQSINIGNSDANDDAIVFLQPSVIANAREDDTLSNLVSQVVAHEAGHLLGLFHTLGANNLLYPLTDPTGANIAIPDLSLGRAEQQSLPDGLPGEQNTYATLAANVGLNQLEATTGPVVAITDIAGENRQTFSYTFTSIDFQVYDAILVSATLENQVIDVQRFDTLTNAQLIDFSTAAQGGDVVLFSAASEAGGERDVFITTADLTEFDFSTATDEELIAAFATPVADLDGDLNIVQVNPDGTVENLGIVNVTLNLEGVNDAPVVTNPLENQASPEDTELSYTIPADAFSDPDGDDLFYTASLAIPIVQVQALADAADGREGPPLPEWLSFDAETLTFFGTPPLNYDGQLEVVVTATDPDGLEASDTFILNITSVNDAPVLDNPLADQAVDEDTAINFTIPFDAFSDPDFDFLNYSATLAVPIFQVQALADAADSPEGPPLPEWLTFDENTRTFSGTPPQDYNGTLDVTVTASDGELTVSDTFTLEITPVNDAPVLDNPLADQASEEDTAVSFTIPSDAFSDPEDTPLTYSASLAIPIFQVTAAAADGPEGPPLPEWLSFDAETLTFSGTPPLNYDGQLDVTVTASDGELTVSDTFTLDITAVNDAPVLDNPLADQTVDEDTAISFTIPEDAFSDPDGEGLTYTAGLTGIPQITAVSDDGPAIAPLPEWLSFDSETLTFSGTPPQDFNGELLITVIASDGELTASDTFTLDITAVNDAPVLDNPLADQSVDEDTQVSFTIPADAFSDPEGTPLTYSASLAIPIIQVNATAAADGPPLPDWLSFDANTLTFSGTPPQDFSGTLDVTVTASDGELTASDTFTLEITPVNDAPILANTLADQTFEEDAEVSFTLPTSAFTDVDSILTLRTSALPAWLAFEASTLTFSGTPPTNYNGSTEVTVTASDGEFEVSDTFTIEITPVNDGPVAVNDEGFEADSGTALTITAADLLSNDTDAENDDLNIIAVNSASGNADVSLDEDGNVVYTASSDFDGDDSFTYTVSDGNGGEATATVSVTVEGDDTTDPYEGWQVGTEGNDNLFGSLFSSNQIYGDAGNDRIFGGFRNDQLDGGEGNDRIYGRWGNDIINGNEGHDRIDGGSGHDIINGGQGNDRLYGNWGNDNLSGGEGNDRLYGHWGKDTISGGKGNDILWGGWDQDNFVFNTGDGADTVTDFSTGFSWWWYRVAGDTITLDVDGIENYADVLDAASQNGRHTTFDFGDDDSLTLRNTRLSSLDQDDFTIL